MGGRGDLVPARREEAVKPVLIGVAIGLVIGIGWFLVIRYGETNCVHTMIDGVPIVVCN